MLQQARLVMPNLPPPRPVPHSCWDTSPMSLSAYPTQGSMCYTDALFSCLSPQPDTLSVFEERDPHLSFHPHLISAKENARHMVSIQYVFVEWMTIGT